MRAHIEVECTKAILLDLNRTLACGFDEECSKEISSIQFIQFIEESRIKQFVLRGRSGESRKTNVAIGRMMRR